MVKRLGVYHRTDLDGHSSAAILLHKFPDIQLLGMDYGSNFHLSLAKDYEEIYVVDFSLKKSIMEKLRPKLIWVDHHKTAMEELGEDYKGVRKEGLAACELLWNYLYDKKLPFAIDMLSKYDVWKLDDIVLAFQYGMRNKNTNPVTYPASMQELWEPLFNNDEELISAILDEGIILYGYSCKQVVRAIRSGITFFIEGYKARLINSRQNPSLVPESWAGYDLIMKYFYQPREDKWVYTLYSTEGKGPDVSKIAVKLGGGGHTHAAGFQLPNFIFKMKNLPVELRRA